MSNIVEKVKAKIDNALHKDDTTTTGHNTTGTHHTHQGHHHHHHHDTSTHPAATHAAPLSSTTGGYQPVHSSNVANKLDPRVDTNPNTVDYGHQQTGLAGTHQSSTVGGYGNAPPVHDSNVLNKLDPRVDSTQVPNTTGLAGTHQSSTVGGYGNAPPVHNSNVLNKLDPRVDSTQVPNTTGYPNQQAGIGGGYGTGSHQTTTAGPHDSNLLNKLDPRVDSDRDGSHNLGAATYGPGGASNTNTLGGQHAGYGTTTQKTTAGPHDSNLLNKLDPRVDSDRDGSHNMGAATYGPGGATNPNTLGGQQNVGAYNTTTGTGYGTQTAGPVHDSKLLNKLDPRVDSDIANNTLPGGVHHNPNTTY